MTEKVLWILIASLLMAVAFAVYGHELHEDHFDKRNTKDEDPFKVDVYGDQYVMQRKIYTRTCGTTTKFNNTYFKSPGYPAAYPGASCGKACTIIVKGCNNNVCQLRIDLLDMVLSQPDGNGICNTDALTITGGNSWVPTLCGDNTGQTLLVDFNGKEAIKISVAIRFAAAFARRWNIKLTQIKCYFP